MQTDPEYAAKSRQWIANYHKTYYKERYQSDPSYREHMKACGKFHHFFGTIVKWKTRRTIPQIGCSPEDFVVHLERQFEDGFTWENYGKVWQIDHIKPVADFDLTDPKAMEACWHFTNLRPLHKLDNMQRGTLVKAGKRAAIKHAGQTDLFT